MQYIFIFLLLYEYIMTEGTATSPNLGDTSLNTCEYCGTIFNTLNEKEKHIELEHSDINHKKYP